MTPPAHTGGQHSDNELYGKALSLRTAGLQMQDPGPLPGLLTRDSVRPCFATLKVSAVAQLHVSVILVLPTAKRSACQGVRGVTQYGGGVTAQPVGMHPPVKSNPHIVGLFSNLLDFPATHRHSTQHLSHAIRSWSFGSAAQLPAHGSYPLVVLQYTAIYSSCNITCAKCWGLIYQVCDFVHHLFHTSCLADCCRTNCMRHMLSRSLLVRCGARAEQSVLFATARHKATATTVTEVQERCSPHQHGRQLRVSGACALCCYCYLQL